MSAKWKRRAKQPPYLQVIYTLKHNGYLREKSFPLKQREKAFNLWHNRNASQIVLRHLSYDPERGWYEPSWTDSNISKTSWYYGKPEEWKENFYEWIDNMLKIWRPEYLNNPKKNNPHGNPSKKKHNPCRVHCSICRAISPKGYDFEKRMKWLRTHRKRKHHR